MKLAFLAKKEKPTVLEALSYMKEKGFQVEEYLGSISDNFPEKLRVESYDVIISYISPWIIPKEVLSKTSEHNINFHPGPPEYPGTGCFNFALYNEELSYGSTAHHMESSVDTGEIIAVSRFKISKEESVISLSEKTYSSMLDLFYKVMDSIKAGDILISKEAWKRKPYIRKELEELSLISPDMTKEEIKKRIRSTYFPGKPGPYIEISGKKFEYNPQR